MMLEFQKYSGLLKFPLEFANHIENFTHAQVHLRQNLKRGG